MTADLKRVKAQLDEIIGTEAYIWLLGEIENDAESVLRCLATEPDFGDIRHEQGKYRGLMLAATLLKEPWRRLDKAAVGAADSR